MVETAFERSQKYRAELFRNAGYFFCSQLLIEILNLLTNFKFSMILVFSLALKCLVFGFGLYCLEKGYDVMLNEDNIKNDIRS